MAFVTQSCFQANHSLFQNQVLFQKSGSLSTCTTVDNNLEITTLLKWLNLHIHIGHIYSIRGWYRLDSFFFPVMLDSFMDVFMDWNCVAHKLKKADTTTYLLHIQTNIDHNNSTFTSIIKFNSIINRFSVHYFSHWIESINLRHKKIYYHSFILLIHFQFEQILEPSHLVIMTVKHLSIDTSATANGSTSTFTSHPHHTQSAR